MEVVGDLVSRFPDGACWVDLQGVNEPGLVAAAIGGVVDVHERPGQALIARDTGVQLMIAVAEHAGYFEATGRYVPKMLNLLQQAMGRAHLAEDPTTLGAISAPVMVLLGMATKPFFAASARHVTDHVPNARVHEIPAAGHASPLTHPEALAEALAGFFSSTLQPA